MREPERNIVLAGFKATGKTAVGRRLAERLGYDFADVDAAIEAETGVPVPTFFEERGETAFREVEARVVDRMVKRRRCVIATGGGTVVDPRNLCTLRGCGVVVALTASPETILARLGPDADRPVLRGGSLRARVEGLLAERQGAYAKADAEVNTTGLTIDEVVERVLEAVQSLPSDRDGRPDTRDA